MEAGKILSIVDKEGKSLSGQMRNDVYFVFEPICENKPSSLMELYMKIKLEKCKDPLKAALLLVVVLKMIGADKPATELSEKLQVDASEASNMSLTDFKYISEEIRRKMNTRAFFVCIMRKELTEEVCQGLRMRLCAEIDAHYDNFTDNYKLFRELEKHNKIHYDDSSGLDIFSKVFEDSSEFSSCLKTFKRFLSKEWSDQSSSSADNSDRGSPTTYLPPVMPHHFDGNHQYLQRLKSEPVVHSQSIVSPAQFTSLPPRFSHDPERGYLPMNQDQSQSLMSFRGVDGQLYRHPPPPPPPHPSLFTSGYPPVPSWQQPYSYRQPPPPSYNPQAPVYPYDSRYPSYDSRYPSYEPRHPSYDSRYPSYEPRHPSYDSRYPSYVPRHPSYEPRHPHPSYEPRHPHPSYEPRHPHPSYEPRHPFYNPYESRQSSYGSAPSYNPPVSGLSHTSTYNPPYTDSSVHLPQQMVIQQPQATAVPNIIAPENVPLQTHLYSRSPDRSSNYSVCTAPYEYSATEEQHGPQQIDHAVLAPAQYPLPISEDHSSYSNSNIVGRN